VTNHLRIGEVAELLGITPKTIRHYHVIGLLPEPPRHENGYRLYTPTDLRKLQTIRRLQGYGLTLRQIQFILQSDDTDEDLKRFLLQRDAELIAQIDQLQRQQVRIRAALNRTEAPTSTGSTRTIVEAVLRPIGSALTDVLMTTEAAAFDELDGYPQTAAHADFWEAAFRTLGPRLVAHEHIIILWLERYQALSHLAADDRQVQAWLSELTTSSAAPTLEKMFDLPRLSLLPFDEQAHLQRMLVLLLYEHATPLQQVFLAKLTHPRAMK
jgi:DNA-binding transcriptional MerR regulator